MRYLKGHTGKLRAVVYSPDGSMLATAGDGSSTSTGPSLRAARSLEHDPLKQKISGWNLIQPC